MLFLAPLVSGAPAASQGPRSAVFSGHVVLGDSARVWWNLRLETGRLPEVFRSAVPTPILRLGDSVARGRQRLGECTRYFHASRGWVLLVSRTCTGKPLEADDVNLAFLSDTGQPSLMFGLATANVVREICPADRRIDGTPQSVVRGQSPEQCMYPARRIIPVRRR